jgi:excisionase family DNA binding protein
VTTVPPQALTTREGISDLIDAPLLTVEEAARLLRVGRTTCFKLIRTGALESVPVGRLRRVPAEAIPEYIARLRAANRAA